MTTTSKPLTASKITLATVKSFIKKNSGNIFIKIKSDLDSYTDGVNVYKDAQFEKAEQIDYDLSYTLGIKGAYFVVHSRDYFSAYEDDQFIGIHVYNSCGSFDIAIEKNPTLEIVPEEDVCPKKLAAVILVTAVADRALIKKDCLGRWGQSETDWNTEIRRLVLTMEGKQVTIWTGGNIRNSFETQISICGILEVKAQKHFRVLLSDGTYVYFQPSDVVEFGQYGGGRKFKDGSDAVLKIITPQEKQMEELLRDIIKNFDERVNGIPSNPDHYYNRAKRLVGGGKS